MERIIFQNEEEQNIFILKGADLNDLIMPRKGERVICNKMFMIVKAVEHDYDESTITITVKLM